MTTSLAPTPRIGYAAPTMFGAGAGTLIGGLYGAFRRKGKDEGRLRAILRSAATGGATGAGLGAGWRAGLARTRAGRLSLGIPTSSGPPGSENRAVLASALGASLGGTAAYRLTRRGERKPTTSAKPEEKKPASKVANFHLLDYVYITESINQPLVKAAAATLLLDYKDKEFTKEAGAGLYGGLIGGGLGAVHGLFKNWDKNLGFWGRLKQTALHGAAGAGIGAGLGYGGSKLLGLAKGKGLLSGGGRIGQMFSRKPGTPIAQSMAGPKAVAGATKGVAPAATGMPTATSTSAIAPAPTPVAATPSAGGAPVEPKPGLFSRGLNTLNQAAMPLMLAQGFLGGGGGVPAETPLPEMGYDPTMGHMTQYGMPLDYQQQAMMARFGSPHGMTSYAARLGEFVKQAALPQFETKPLTAHTAIADYIANKKYKPEPNEYTPSEQAQLDQLVKSMSRSAARTVDESRRGRTDVQNKLKKQFLAAGLWQ